MENYIHFVKEKFVIITDTVDDRKNSAAAQENSAVNCCNY